MHAINAIYWIRTNVSSITASALTTKLNAQIVDTNVTLLYASLKSTRSKWPNHYDSLLYQLSYVLMFLERTAGLKPATNGLECKMNIAVWILKWSEWEELHLRITLYKNAAYTARATLGLCLALRQTNSTFQLRMSR